MTDVWKAYYPEDGECADDAHTLTPKTGRRILDAEDAAEIACEYDFDNRDGWERTHGDAFLIVIIDPKGISWRFSARHEPSINHSVSALP
jgi:hypothetical protein